MIKGGAPNANTDSPPAANTDIPDLLMVIHAPGISHIIKKLAVHHSESGIERLQLITSRMHLVTR